MPGRKTDSKGGFKLRLAEKTRAVILLRTHCSTDMFLEAKMPPG